MFLNHCFGSGWMVITFPSVGLSAQGFKSLNYTHKTRFWFTDAHVKTYTSQSGCPKGHGRRERSITFYFLIVKSNAAKIQYPFQTLGTGSSKLRKVAAVIGIFFLYRLSIDKYKFALGTVQAEGLIPTILRVNSIIWITSCQEFDYLLQVTG